MFELFIALFGGGYLFSKYTHEKKAIKAHDLREDCARIERQTRIDLWREKVTDRNLEIELEDFIFQSKNYDAVWKEVSEAFSEMPWNSDRQFICITPEDVVAHYGRGYTKRERENIAYHHRVEALRIMLARRGKLRFCDTSGIYTCGFGAPTVKQGQRANSELADFILWINKKIQSHGVDEPVYFVPIDDSCILPITEENKTKNGEYMWMPSIMLYKPHLARKYFNH